MTTVQRTEWYGHDPRESIDKRDEIVLVVPAIGAFRADVETKHSWYISIHCQALDDLDADASWPSHWRWCFAPST